jgi:hypothetical protein
VVAKALEHECAEEQRPEQSEPDSAAEHEAAVPVDLPGRLERRRGRPPAIEEVAELEGDRAGQRCREHRREPRPDLGLGPEGAAQEVVFVEHVDRPSEEHRSVGEREDRLR